MARVPAFFEPHGGDIARRLDVYKNSSPAYAAGAGDLKLLGKIGTTKTGIDRLCARLSICCAYAVRPSGR